MNDDMKNAKSWFYRWFVDNQSVTVLMVFLLIFLNIFMLTKISFIFVPVLDFITVIMLPMILSALLYYMLKPCVDWLEKQKMPRVWAIGLVFVLVALLLVWGLAVAIPSIRDQIVSFIRNVPGYTQEIEKIVTDLLQDERFDQFRPQVTEVLDNASSQVTGFAATLSTNAVDWVKNFLSAASQVIVAIIIMPFILFYLLRDGNQLKGSMTKFLPTKWRAGTARVLRDVNTQLANYVRGQITVAIIVAIMFAIMFSIVGLDYAVTLGVMAGFLNLIPYLGSFLAMIPALVLALVAGPTMLIKVIIVFIVEQTIEGRFVTPLILGSSLKIHPITILFVLLTAGKMFGLWGVLIGIPVYASLKVIIGALFDWYKDYSGLYQPEEEVADEVTHVQ